MASPGRSNGKDQGQGLRNQTAETIEEPITSFRGEYRWLSNFHLCPVDFEGLRYPSAEHAYQAAKTLNLHTRTIFLNGTAADAKRRGNDCVLIQLRHDWDEVKLSVMETVLRSKFEPGSMLAARLKATGDQLLIEENHWQDCFWGQCPLGNGENNLGRLLMKIREEL